MFTKILIAFITILVLSGIGIYIFRDEIKSLVHARMTDKMFLEEDLDDYDPGITLADRFPLIKVSADGKIYNDLDSFLGPRGLVVLFSRSVVW